MNSTGCSFVGVAYLAVLSVVVSERLRVMLGLTGAKTISWLLGPMASFRVSPIASFNFEGYY